MHDDFTPALAADDLVFGKSNNFRRFYESKVTIGVGASSDIDASYNLNKASPATSIVKRL